MSCKTLLIPIALLAASALGADAASEARNQDFSVEASAATTHHPGTDRKDSGHQPGYRAAFATSDPPPARLGGGPSDPVWADSSARTGATQGVLDAELAVLSRSGSLDGSGEPVSSWSEARFTDTLEVVSSTLPAGTPVTLTFHATLIGWRLGAGEIEGDVACTLSVDDDRATAYWTLEGKGSETEPASADLVVSTFVGARLVVTGELQAEARAFSSGSVVDPESRLTLGTYCTTPAESADPDVDLVAASGTQFLEPAS